MHTFNRYITKQSTRNNESEKNNLNKISGVWLERVRDVGISQLGMENEKKNKTKKNLLSYTPTQYSGFHTRQFGPFGLGSHSGDPRSHGIWLNGPRQTSSFLRFE